MLRFSFKICKTRLHIKAESSSNQVESCSYGGGRYPFGSDKEKFLLLSNMQRTIQISTPDHNCLCDINRQVEAIVAESGVQTGIVNVYVQGTTTGIMM